MRAALFVLALVVGSAWSAAPFQKDKETVRELTGVTATTKAGDVTKPAEIKTEEEAAKVFSKEALDQMKKNVDFAKEKMLCFDWAGSGMDSLSFKIMEKKEGKEVIFTLKPGLTRDYRMHSRVYVLPKEFTFRVER